jgi:hypothetical protein
MFKLSKDQLLPPILFVLGFHYKYLQEDYHEHCSFGGEILQLGEFFLK